MKRYVIFREDTFADHYREVYIDGLQNLKSTLMDTTDRVRSAMHFPTAREAYEWAGIMGLDFWRVGAR